MLREYKETWYQSFNFKGRTTKENWIKAIGLHLILALLPVCIIGYMEWENVIAYLWEFFAACSLIPILSCTVRRMHDGGKSGWYLLLCWVLSFIAVGFIMFILALRKQSVGENQWGAAPGEKSPAEDSFVDETLTEDDVKRERKNLILIIIKIIGIMLAIIAGLCMLYFFLDEILLL